MNVHQINPFHKVLRDTIADLPDVLQQIITNDEIYAQGRFIFSRSNKVFPNVVANIMMFPKNVKGLRSSLQITNSRQNTTWIRKFGRTIFKSKFIAHNRILEEKLGFLSFLFKLEVANKELQFHSVQTKLLGCTLPPKLGTQIFMNNKAVPSGWSVSVSVKSPLIGKIITYSGVMHIVNG